MVPVLLIFYFVVGLPACFFLYLATPYLHRKLDYWGQRSSGIKPVFVLGGVIVVSLLGYGLGLFLRLSILSQSSVYTSLFAIICAAVIALGVAGLFKRRDIGMSLFIMALLCLAGLVLISGYDSIFDGLRLVDFILVSAIVVIFMGGLTGLWASRTLLFGIMTMVILAYGIHFATGYSQMFSYTSGEYEAATWLEANSSVNVTIATDTKMSLLLLGVADRNATYEGSSWLFDSSTLKESIEELNEGQPVENSAAGKVILGQYTTGSVGSNTGFLKRPIRYVLIADYMMTSGADVSWFSAPLKPSADLEVVLDQLGNRVYSHDGVIIWQLS